MEAESSSDLEAFGTADELDQRDDDEDDDDDDESEESSPEGKEYHSASDESECDESEASSAGQAPEPEEIEHTELREESEEDDSGVTSDISRHISETDTDPECGSELGKMTRCQRAATHSRLFKLLQEECGQDEEEEETSIADRKERLSLPLCTNSSSDSSSGVNSPSSPTVNTRLVKELVQSLLSKKKGRHFRKLPIEKLHAAALRILQEDMDPYDTGSTSDEGPRTSLADKNTAEICQPEIYGGNYYDYCNYYNTWANACYQMEPDMSYYDIVPSRTFKGLRDGYDKSGGISVRCPRTPYPSYPFPTHPSSESNGT